jgi:hypothetical protein
MASGRLQQSPQPKGGGIFKSEWWQVWEGTHFPVIDLVIASLDSAFTEKQENDPSALTVWGVFKHPGLGKTRCMGIALDGCQTAAALFEFERVAAAAFDGDDVGDTGSHAHALEDRGLDRGAPATVSGMECEHRGRGPDGQMLEHGALDLLLRLCGTWSAVRSGDRLALHYCRSADRRRPPPVGRKFRGGDGDNLRMESTRKP